MKISDWLRSFEDYEAPVFKHKPHKPVKMKAGSWMRCQSCGLIYLKTPLTQWSIKKGCNYKEAPGFKEAVKRLT